MFHLLRNHGMNVTANLSRPDYDKLREIIIDLVLATDITDSDRQDLVKKRWEEALQGGLDTTKNESHRRTCVQLPPTPPPPPLLHHSHALLLWALQALSCA